MTEDAAVSKTVRFAWVIAVGLAAIAASGRVVNAQQAQIRSGGTVAPSVGPATFPHQKHFEALAVECTACHHETNARALRMPHKKYFDDFWTDCRICHQRAGASAGMPQSCSACHHSSPTSIADETLSAKVVIHKKCWECHESGKGEAASKGCAKCHARAPAGTAGTQSPGVSSKHR